MNAPLHIGRDEMAIARAHYRCGALGSVRTGGRYQSRLPTVLHVREEHGPANEPTGRGEYRRGRDAGNGAPPAPALEPESVSSWHLVHERIIGLGAERAAHERELCRWLRAAERLEVHRHMGFASLREYAERVVGLRGRQLEERLRVARALALCPGLDEALATGELCWSTVRELSRVASAETEGAWRRWAKGRRSREIEQAVGGRRPGESPDAQPDPALVKHRLRFEVRAETMALFRDLQATVRAELGGETDDDTLLYEIARRALGGPGDEGRASYQVAVTRCAECGRTSIDAGGESHAVSEAVAEMVACDCAELGRVDGEEATSPQVGAADDCTSTKLVGECPHAGAAAPARPKARATQTIPPATRRQVMRRDRGRCVVPGCQNHRFLDVHHLLPRSEGGGHDPDQLAVLCGSHHRAAHAGTLDVGGSVQSGLTFRHADGTPYGERVRPPAVEVAEQVFGALRHMGFKHTEARARVDAVTRESAPDELEAFLRAALLAT